MGQLENGKDTKENIKSLTKELSTSQNQRAPLTNYKNKQPEIKEKIHKISEICEEKEPNSIYYDPTPINSFEKSPTKSALSNRTITKSSINNRSVTPTPKKKQLIIQNHYLNKENHSYKSIMDQKKKNNIKSYQKTLNSSNIEIKLEKSVLGKQKYTVSSQQKSNYLKKPEKIKSENNENVSALHVNLNIQMGKFQKFQNPQTTKGNSNLVDDIPKNKSNNNLVNSSLQNSETEYNILNNVRSDIDNLKSRMETNIFDQYLPNSIQNSQKS